MPVQTKPLMIQPAIGLGLDARSNPSEVDLGTWRHLLNFGVTAKGRLCRIPGWDKFLTATEYNNADLHDQLLSETGFPSRLPVTFLFEAVSTRKSTKLIAGTQNALYAQNSGTGNWKVISDRLGADGARWRAAQLNDSVIFTNNVDKPVVWLFDQGVTEANDQSVATIEDLDEIGISKVGTVIVWQGTVFLMNVTVNGAVQSASVFWSNYQKPLDWIPNEGSTAGSSDLGYGETILNAIPLGNRLLIFTDRGIWECQAVGGEQVFAFTKRYDPVKGEACLFYPNTLVSKGDEIVYLGIDGIYAYSFYVTKPQRVEWMHKASSLMFDYINRNDCLAHVAAYNSQRKEILFSYAKNDESIPSETLVCNAEYPWAYILDHGFSAMVNFTARSSSQTIRDFFLAHCICDESGLDTYWSQFTKEGGYCEAPETITCNQTPASIFTVTEKEIEYLDESVTTEDYDAAEADEDSLCAILGDVTLGSLCESEIRQDECSSGLRFVVASSTDYCLKEFSQNYYREQCATFTGCGSYNRLGYRSRLRSGPITAGDYQNNKEISRLELEASSSVQTTPSQFGLRIGRHSQAVDPNYDDCGIVWDDQDPVDIECLGEVSAATHIAENTIPSKTYDWPLYYEAKYLYFELSVENSNVFPVDTGGATCISWFTLNMRPIQTRW